MNSSDNTDLLKIFANDQRMILYRPEWRTFTGSVTATILLQQILYRWDKNDRKPFYKFKEPCGHDLYRPGDSWTEELGFSRKEFDSALKKIGAKRTRKTEGPTTSLVEYWTDINRITYYNINPGVLQSELDKLYAASNEPGFTKSPKGDLPVKSKRGFTKITNEDLLHYKQRLHTDNDDVQSVKSDTPPTPESEPTRVAQEPKTKPSSSFSESELITILATLMALIPEQHRKPSVEKTIEKGLKAHSTDYVRLAVLYTIANSNGGTWQKFKAYLGKCIENHWHDGWDPDIEKIVSESICQGFMGMPDKDLKFLADAGNRLAIEELERRKLSGSD